MHSVAVSENGGLYTWGFNDDAALGRKAKDEEEFLPGKVPLPEGNMLRVKVFTVENTLENSIEKG